MIPEQREKKNFFDLSFKKLMHFLKDELLIEEKKLSMRTKQIWQSIYKKGFHEVNSLTTLPVEMREKLASLLSFTKPKIIKKQTSKDGTIKWLIQLFDKNEVECV